MVVMAENETHEKKQEKPEIRGIVRLVGKDIKGEMQVVRALTRVKGVGVRLSRIFSDIAGRKIGFDSATPIGALSEPQIEQLEEILSHPGRWGVPAYMLNRQKDVESGADAHLVGTDLSFTVRQDIEREKTVNSYRGNRHQFGQKVRGQRTRSTGRTGMTVGVLRKAVLKKGVAPAAATTAAAPAAAGAATPEAAAKPKAAAAEKTEKK
jgi:small subunit ribosomal protein S13